MGRADDDVAGVGGGVELDVRREVEAELRADAGEAMRLGLEHDRQAGGSKGAEDFLALAEAVAEQDGRGADGESVAAEREEVGDDFGGGREDVAREAERRFHDERVGARGGAGFGGVAGQEFEIAGVEERAVLGVIEENLGGAVDVAGGVERDGAVGGELLGMAEGEDVLGALLRREAGAHEAGSGAGAEDLGVARHVIGVGVGNETALGSTGGVERPADLRKVDAVFEIDFPSHVSRKGRGGLRGRRKTGWIGEKERRRDGERSGLA